MALLDAGLERREVAVDKVTLRDVWVCRIPGVMDVHGARVLHGIGGVMLAAGARRDETTAAR